MAKTLLQKGGGSKSGSVTLSEEYDYIKVWVGGDAFNTGASHPILFDTKYPAIYTVRGDGEAYSGGYISGTTQASITQINLTDTKISWYSYANNFSYVNGVVGIKFK